MGITLFESYEVDASINPVDYQANDSFVCHRLALISGAKEFILLVMIEYLGEGAGAFLLIYAARIEQIDVIL